MRRNRATKGWLKMVIPLVVMLFLSSLAVGISNVGITLSANVNVTNSTVTVRPLENSPLDVLVRIGNSTILDAAGISNEIIIGDFSDELNEILNDGCRCSECELSNSDLTCTVYLQVEGNSGGVELSDLSISQEIKDAVWPVNENYTLIDLDDYFYDPLGGDLSYFVDVGRNITAEIDEDGIVKLIPAKDWVGTEELIIEAENSAGTVRSNMIKLDVIDSTAVQMFAEINKPVRWKKKVHGDSTTLPDLAFNISVDGIYDGIDEVSNDVSNEADGRGRRKVGDEKIKVLHNGKEKSLQKYELDKKAELLERKLAKEKRITGYESELMINESGNYEIFYDTEAPVSVENKISGLGKRIVVSGPDELHYQNVLAYTYLEQEVSENKVRLYWVVNDTRTLVETTNYDTNNNSLIDYVEWIVPHLSEQEYELVIEISKAEHLNSTRGFVADVYDYVKVRDDIWVEIPDGDYLRVVFEQMLDSGKDITIYARSNSTGNVKVYEKDSDELIADFGTITADGKYQIFLNNLNGTQDIFDLLVTGNVEFDYVVDPSDGAPNIDFVDPTPVDGFNTTDQSFIVNVSINEDNLETVVYNFNGVNYSYFDDNLILFYNFDNVSAIGEHNTKVVDVSGNSVNGTVVGATLVDSGKSYNAYYFEGGYGVNGLGNHVNFSDIDFKDTASASMWVKFENIDNFQALLSQHVPSEIRFLMRGSPNYQFRARVDTPSGNCNTQSSTLAEVGKWYHLAFTYDGSSTKLFINGILESQNSVSSGCVGDISDFNKDYSIGAWPDGLYSANATIDEVMIWNRTLSDDEVSQLYHTYINKLDADDWILHVNQTRGATNLLYDGTYTYQAFASDESGNSNSTEERDITVDTTVTVNIVYPERYGGYVSNVTSINYTTDGDEYCWYSLNNSFNSSLVSAGTNFTKNFGDGEHNLTVYCNDTLGNIGQDDFSFVVGDYNVAYEKNKIMAYDGGASDRFGSSVAISGDYAVIGADNNYDVYIYKRNSSGQFGYLQKIDTSSCGIGTDISISGDYMILGAGCENVGVTTYAGSAYIYKKNPLDQFEQVNQIVASDNEAYDEFGDSVSISGDYAIVGAERKGLYTGAAYVYKKNSSGEYEEVNKIMASDNETGDWFGISVSISGDYAIVGADHEETGGTNAGAAYIFKKNSSGQFEEVNKIMASDIQDNDLFGSSVSISGDYAIVGSYGEDTGGNAAGAAYIFRKNSSGEFEEVNKIQGSDKQSPDNFGDSVSISGDYAIVGSYNKDSATGAAYVFKKNSSNEYEEINKIEASDKEAGDKFGDCVAISGDTAVVGAYSEDTLGSNAGAAYLFELGEDFYAPNVSLISPANDTMVSGISIFVFNATDISLKNATLYVWNSTGLFGTNSTDISGGFSESSLSLGGLSEMDYTWNVLVYDVVGYRNWSETNWTFSVDATEPSIVLNAPIDVFNTSETSILFNWTAIDTYSVNLTCNLTVGGVVNVSDISVVNNTPYNVTVSGFNDGNYDWNVSCWDNVSNVNTSLTRSFTVDTTGPSFVLNAPIDYFNTSDTFVLFNWTAIDQHFVNLTCNLTVGGVVNVSDISVVNGTPYNVTVSDFKEGNYDWNVTCWDGVNNTNTSVTRSFTVDTTEPSVVLNAPVDGFNTSDTFVMFNWTAVDNIYVPLLCNLTVDGVVNVSDISVVNGTPYNVTVSGFRDGIYDWNVTCWDGADNMNVSATRSFTVDTTEPSVVLNAPVDGFNTSEISVEFNWTAIDNIYVPLLCNLTVDGVVNVSDISVVNNTPYNLTVSGFRDGMYDWNVTCWDNLFNVNTSETRSFTVDTTEPSIVLNDPIDVFNTSDTSVMFNWTGVDNIFTSLLCNLTVDGVVNISDITIVNGTPYNVTVSDFKERNYDWNVTCWDGVNNTNTSVTRSFTVDTTEPSVVLNAPGNNSKVNYTSVAFNWTATDNIYTSLTCNLTQNGTVVNANIVVANGTPYNITKTGFTFSDYVWNITCWDSANNINTSETRVFTFANNVTATSCGTLDLENGYYILEDNITIQDSNCFTIGSNGITVDCKNYWIRGNNNSGQKGFYSDGYDNISLINCNLADFGTADAGSCPFVYSWDGNEYVLDSEAVSGFTLSPLAENTMLSRLPSLYAGDTFKIKITEELNEVSYLNKAELIVVEHAPGTEVYASMEGMVHTIRDPISPVSCIASDGTDCLGLMEEDGVFWSGNDYPADELRNRNHTLDEENMTISENIEDYEVYIELTFPKQSGKDTAKLLYSVKEGSYSDFMLRQFQELMGNDYRDNMTAYFEAMINKIIETKTFMSLEIWNGSEWVSDHVFFEATAIEKAFEMVKVINISNIPGDEIKLRFTTTNGRHVDYALLDYSEDEYSIIGTQLPDNTSLIENDEDYIMLGQGDEIEMEYENIFGSGSNRTYFLAVTGYYIGNTRYSDEPNTEKLGKILEPGTMYGLQWLTGAWLNYLNTDRDHHSAIHIINAKNVLIENIVIDNTVNIYEDGIYFNNVRESTIRDVTISDVRCNALGHCGEPMDIISSSNNTIEQITLLNSDSGIRLFGGMNNTLNDIYAIDLTGTILYMNGSDNNQITDFVIDSEGSYGLGISASNYNSFDNITSSRMDYGIGIGFGSYNNTITNSVLSSNTDGIYVSYDGSASVYNLLLDNVTANSNSGYGIYLDRTVNTTMRNCNMSNNSINFRLDIDSDDQIYHDIDTSNIVDYAYKIYYNYSISDKVYDSSTTDVGMIGCSLCDNITVRDINLSHDNGAGVGFYGTSNSIIDNVTSDDNTYGISLLSGSNISIFNTVANSNNICGVNLFRINNSDLENISVSSNTKFGILLNQSYSNSIENVTANSNTLVGIGVQYGEDNIIRNSNMNGNGDAGLYLDNIQGSIFLNNNMQSITEVSSTGIDTIIYNNTYGEVKWNLTDLSTSIPITGAAVARTFDRIEYNISASNINYNNTIQLRFNKLYWSGSSSDVNLVKNGEPCASPQCNITYYNSTEGVLNAQVSGFSNYTTNGTSVMLITLNAPVNYYNTTNRNITFNWTTVSDLYLTMLCNLTIDGQLNQTNIKVQNNTPYNITVYSFPEGKYNWNVTCWNGTRVNTSETMNFTVDTTEPSVVLNAPVDGFNTSDTFVMFNWTAVDNLQNKMLCNLTVDGVVNVSDISVDNGIPYNATVSGFNDRTYNWNVTCWDYANNVNTSLTRGFNVSLPPIVALNAPADDSWYDTGAINFNYTVTGSGLNTCEFDGNFSGSWELNKSNSTLSSGVPDIISLNLDDGNYIWNVKCNNTFGGTSWAAANYSLDVDTITPALEIISPTNINYSSATQLVNISSSDTNLDTTWYNWNGTNYTYVSELNIVFAEGSNVLHAWANDSAGNLNYTNVSFTIDTIAPVMDIKYPVDKGAYISNVTSINYTVDSADYCWYSLNDSFNFSTVSAGTNFTHGFTVGEYNLTVYCNDTVGNVGQDNITFIVGDYNVAYELNKIQGSDRAGTDNYGWSVSISGDYAIVGSRYEEGTGTVYVYQRNSSGEFEEVNQIYASDKQTGDYFGQSVSISGDYAIIGAHGEDTGGEDAGAAYVFKKNSSGQFEEVNKIIASNNGSTDNFGYSVAISGDYAIVGAYFEDSTASDAGSAYIFKKNSSGQYEELNKIQASDAQESDYFGYSVSISGDYAIIGAYGEDTPLSGTGAAYIFKKNSSGQFEEVNKIQASDKGSADSFGYSVSISGDSAIISAYYKDIGGVRAGAAYVFRKGSSGDFEEVNRITASDAELNDYFGYSVSISGEYAIVGALEEDTGGAESGAAYVFKKNSTGQFEEVNKIQANDRQAGDYFGHSVSISGKYAITGAYSEDTGGADAGAAYLFELEKDYDSPSVVLVSLIDGLNTTNEYVMFNWTAADNLDPYISCNLTINGIVNVSDITVVNGTYYNLTVSGLNDGWYDWNVTCWDDADNVNYSLTRGFNVSLPPVVTLNAPADDIWLDSGAVTFNYTATGGDLDTCVLYGDFSGTWGVNESNSSLISGVPDIISLSLDDGNYIWNVKCNNSFGGTTWADANSSLHIDTVYPGISFIDPTLDSESVTGDDWVEVNISINESNIDEIVYNWNGTNFTIYNDSLLLMMNFDNRSALGENDSKVVGVSQYQSNGTVNGGTVWTSSGIHGGAFSFNGAASDFIKIEPEVSLSNNDLTIAYWVYPTNIVTGQVMLMNKALYTSTYGFQIALANTNLNIRGSSSTVGSFVNYFTGRDNMWTFVTLKFSGTTVSAYRDGQYIDSKTVAAITGEGQHHICVAGYGTNCAPYNFGGSIDEIRIFNRSLSEPEINQLYMTNLQKFDQTQWYLYVNQTKNSTAGLDDNIYTYQAFISDMVGNSNSTEERNVTVDTTEPSILLNAPTDNTNTSETSILFNWTAIDKFSVNMTCNLTIDGVVNVSDVSVVNNTPYNVTVNGFRDGRYDWNVTCWDHADNTNTSETRNLIVDTVEPSVILNAPVDGFNSSESYVTFNWTATDILDGNLLCNLTINKTVNISDISVVNATPYDVTVSDINDGSYIWNVTCWDHADNANTSLTRKYSVDTTAPTIIIIYPADKGVHIPNVTSINYTTDADSYCWYTTDHGATNSSNVAAGAGFSTNFALGDYNLTVFCNDTVGNLGEESINFSVHDYNAGYEVNKLLSSDIQSGDGLGWSVSISGDYAIVGAQQEDTGGDKAGAAYIYKKNSSGQFEEVNKIMASDNATNDRFGISVSISDDYAIVGAALKSSETGAAYIFKKNSSGEFEEVNKIEASDKDTGDRFGRSVSISGDYAIVGAYFEGAGGVHAGAAYIFRKNSSGEFEEVHKMQASNKGADDLFGNSVSILDDYAIVGAPGEDTTAGNSGAAYIFKRNSSGGYEEVDLIKASAIEADDLFGNSVSLSADYAIVGAYWVGGADASGSAYVYRRDASDQYTEVSRLQASDKTDSNNFGDSVSISGDYAIVGAGNAKTNGVITGGAYVFKKNSSGEFEEVNKIVASDKQSGDDFGDSAAISGEYAIVGAEFEDAGGDDAGAAYLFKLEVDLVNPVVSLLSPIDNFNTSESYVMFNWTAADNLDPYLSCNLTINGVVNVSDDSAANGTPYNITVSGFNDGWYDWNVTCWDDASNLNISETRSFIVDTTEPSIVLNDPVDGFNTSNISIMFNWTATDVLDDSFLCNLTINGIVNISDISVVNATPYNVTVSTFDDDIYYWNVTCWDHANNVNTSLTYNFTINRTSTLNQIYPNSSFEWTDVVNRSYYIELADHTSQYFNISYTDTQSDTTIRWYVNDEEQISSLNSVSFFWRGNYTISGDFNITVKLVERFENTTFTWNLTVNNTDLVITNVTVFEDGRFEQNWTALTDVTRYDIYYSSDPNTGFTLWKDTQINSFNYTIQSSDTKQFYQIRAVIDSGEEVISNKTGYWKVQLKRKEGSLTRNWLALPLEEPDITKAKHLLTAINASSVSYWNETSQQAVTCNQFLCPDSCTAQSCNFELETGRMYEIDINESQPITVNWTMAGILADTENITLVKKSSSESRNWVSILSNTSITNAAGIASSIGSSMNVVSIWDATNQVAQGYIRLFGNFFVGKNFAADATKGYEIWVNQNVSWIQE